jgi:hypothetical protein
MECGNPTAYNGTACLFEVISEISFWYFKSTGNNILKQIWIIVRPLLSIFLNTHYCFQAGSEVVMTLVLYREKENTFSTWLFTIQCQNLNFYVLTKIGTAFSLTMKIHVFTYIAWCNMGIFFFFSSC